MSRPPSRRAAVLATLLAVLLLAALPALLGLLAPAAAPEAGLSPAGVARDVSAAALDRLDRLLQGEWCVTLDAPGLCLACAPAPAGAAPALEASQGPARLRAAAVAPVRNC